MNGKRTCRLIGNDIIGIFYLLFKMNKTPPNRRKTRPLKKQLTGGC
jgi:hypothetical protein